MNTLYPGIYIENEAGTEPTIGTSKKIGAFVGVASKGEVGTAVLVNSWPDFVRKYGSFSNNSYLAYAVKGFFQNGGQYCYVVRTVHYTDSDPISVKSSIDLDNTDVAVAKVTAKTDGAWGNDISVAVTNNTTSIDLAVYYDDELVKTYKGLTTETMEAMVASSDYIDVTVIDEEKLPDELAKTALTNGSDGLTGIADTDYIGTTTLKNGLYALDGIKINYVAIPGITTSAVLAGILTYVDARRDCFAVLDIPLNSTVSEAETFVSSNSLSSENTSIYYPYLKVSDAIGIGTSPTKLVPPSGHVMGAIAKTCYTKGSGRAPAGLDVALEGVLGLETGISDDDQGILNPSNINCIRAFDGEGICVWGARTLSTGDYKYNSVKLYELDLKERIKNSTRWVSFKPNDSTLWSNITSTLKNILKKDWKRGFLKGDSEDEAFFIKCDSELNTDEVIDEGKTYADIGIATTKPNEFLIVRLSLR